MNEIKRKNRHVDKKIPDSSGLVTAAVSKSSSTKEEKGTKVESKIPNVSCLIKQ